MHVIVRGAERLINTFKMTTNLRGLKISEGCWFDASIGVKMNDGEDNYFIDLLIECYDKDGSSVATVERTFGSFQIAGLGDVAFHADILGNGNSTHCENLAAAILTIVGPRTQVVVYRDDREVKIRVSVGGRAPQGEEDIETVSLEEFEGTLEPVKS